MLLAPKELPITKKASANNIILNIKTNILGLISTNWLIAKANPETPPAAISNGKKKYSNPNATIATPTVAKKYTITF